MSENSKCGLSNNSKVAKAADACPRCMQVTHDLMLQGGLTEVLNLLGRIKEPQEQGNARNFHNLVTGSQSVQQPGLRDNSRSFMSRCVRLTSLCRQPHQRDANQIQNKTLVHDVSLVTRHLRLLNAMSSVAGKGVRNVSTLESLDAVAQQKQMGFRKLSRQQLRLHSWLV